MSAKEFVCGYSHPSLSKLVVFLFVMLILGCTQRSAAQMGPGTFADANLPSGAPDPQKEDSIWQVDPLTGALNVKIPFTTTPAGGRGPKIPFALLYNSSSTITLQSFQTQVIPVPGSGTETVQCSQQAYDGCVITSDSENSIPSSSSGQQIIQSYAWAPGNINTPNGPVGPWTTSGPYLYNSYTYTPDAIFNVSPGYGTTVQINLGYGCSIWGPYLYADEDGAVHDVNQDTVAPSPAGGSGAAYSDTMTGACNNAWYYYTNESASLGVTGDGSSLFAPNRDSVQYPDGTTFTAGPNPYSATGASVNLFQSLEDTNGNISQITNYYNTNGYYSFQDSEGRTPYTTNIPIGLPAQIPAGNYYVRTKDAKEPLRRCVILHRQRERS